jgi:pyridoxal phosphate enzyme (YggS family)
MLFFSLILLLMSLSTCVSYRSIRLATFSSSKLFVKVSVNSQLRRNMSAIVENTEIVKEKIREAAVHAGKDPNSIRLVAVSKTKPVEDILELYNHGHRHFGENYFQELMEKAEKLPNDIQWHFIGHLQSQKASKLIRDLPNLFMLETIDSEKLAAKLHSACQAASRSEPLRVFLQIDTSGEDTKSGVSPGQEMIQLANYILKECSGSLKIAGLMTIGAPGDFSCFDRLVHCREELAGHLNVPLESLELSMGMSGDFEEAIKRGATSVRVGSTIFGPRIYQEKEKKEEET